MYDLIVIGAGPGGYEAAAHAGQMGKKVALVEKQHVGGVCLNKGCIPTKTFLKSSRLFADCAQASAYGIKVSAPRLDMRALQARKAKIVKTLTRGVEGLLKRSKVERFAGHGELLSDREVRVGDQRAQLPQKHWGRGELERSVAPGLVQRGPLEKHQAEGAHVLGVELGERAGGGACVLARAFDAAQPQQPRPSPGQLHRNNRLAPYG